MKRTPEHLTLPRNMHPNVRQNVRKKTESKTAVSCPSALEALTTSWQKLYVSKKNKALERCWFRHIARNLADPSLPPFVRGECLDLLKKSYDRAAARKIEQGLPSVLPNSLSGPLPKPLPLSPESLDESPPPVFWELVKAVSAASRQYDQRTWRAYGGLCPELRAYIGAHPKRRSCFMKKLSTFGIESQHSFVQQAETLQPHHRYGRLQGALPLRPGTRRFSGAETKPRAVRFQWNLQEEALSRALQSYGALETDEKQLFWRAQANPRVLKALASYQNLSAHEKQKCWSFFTALLRLAEETQEPTEEQHALPPPSQPPEGEGADLSQNQEPIR